MARLGWPDLRDQGFALAKMRLKAMFNEMFSQYERASVEVIKFLGVNWEEYIHLSSGRLDMGEVACLRLWLGSSRKQTAKVFRLIEIWSNVHYKSQTNVYGIIVLI